MIGDQIKYQQQERLCIAIFQVIIPGLIAVITVESTVKYFCLKRQQGEQVNTKLTLSPCLHVKRLMTAIIIHRIFSLTCEWSKHVI